MRWLTEMIRFWNSAARLQHLNVVPAHGVESQSDGDQHRCGKNKAIKLNANWKLGRENKGPSWLNSGYNWMRWLREGERNSRETDLLWWSARSDCGCDLIRNERQKELWGICRPAKWVNPERMGFFAVALSESPSRRICSRLSACD